LLARVIVNRLWQHHIGRGIVATPTYFGIRGEKPTHPELLDFLASQADSQVDHAKRGLSRKLGHRRGESET
jgi:Protein of unknown function (DUF1553)